MKPSHSSTENTVFTTILWLSLPLTCHPHELWSTVIFLPVIKWTKVLRAWCCGEKINTILVLQGDNGPKRLGECCVTVFQGSVIDLQQRRSCDSLYPVSKLRLPEHVQPRQQTDVLSNPTRMIMTGEPLIIHIISQRNPYILVVCSQYNPKVHFSPMCYSRYPLRLA